MKIVVFGPDYRVGAWEGDRVIDLARGFARSWREKHGDADADTQAAGQVPSKLAAFIEGGDAVLERVSSSGKQTSNSTHPGRGERGSVVPAGTSLTISPARQPGARANS